MNPMPPPMFNTPSKGFVKDAYLNAAIGATRQLRSRATPASPNGARQWPVGLGEDKRIQAKPGVAQRGETRPLTLRMALQGEIITIKYIYNITINNILKQQRGNTRRAHSSQPAKWHLAGIIKKRASCLPPLSRVLSGLVVTLFDRTGKSD